MFYEKNEIKRTSVISLRKMFVAINEVTIVNCNFVLLSAVRFLCVCGAFFILVMARSLLSRMRSDVMVNISGGFGSNSQL